MSETRRAWPAPEILDDLLALCREPAAVAGEAAFDGADPVLPTPLRIGDFGGAAIAAAAVTAARLHVQRGGERQPVAIAIDAATMAMRSSRHIRHEPPLPPAAPGRRPVGFYETADGRWFFFQRLFPHHFERQLQVLGCEADDDAITAAVRGWDGLELEQRVVDAGACGALVRTAAEWEATEHARALARLPLLEIRRIGDAPPQPLPPAPRPLSGVRVLDVTRVLAGPTSARTLAEHGAEILRVGTARPADDATMMLDTGHGKRSCALDLQTPSGQEALWRLIDGADVFSQGYRPGALARLGFSAEALAARRPGIVSVSISAFGRSGPWHARRGFDSVVQAASGICDELRSADGRPGNIPANPLDYITGYLAAAGVTAALRRRAVDGGSWHVELSLAQAGRYLTRLARADPAEVAQRPGLPPAQRLEELMTTRDTPYGTLRYFAPVAQLPATPAHWALPTVPLDHDAPEWADAPTDWRQ